MVYLKEHIQSCINASGRMTKLGVSTPSPTVLEAMEYGATHYFLIDDLYKEAGYAIAHLLGAPDTVVTSSASAGITLSVASIVCKHNPNYIQHLADINQTTIPREIVLPKGHNVNFGAPIETMIELGGGICVEAGYANQCSVEDVNNCISDQTAALMYVKSSHCVQKDTLSLEQMLEIAHNHKLPLILDCAAEVDFTSFHQLGIDYVIYSGSKALMGPTSGFVIVQSTNQAIELRKHLYGVGRGMKVGKENIFGLVQAVYEYMNGQNSQIVSYDDLDPFITKLNTLKGIQASKTQDESGRAIYRAKIHFDETILKLNATQVIHYLETGTPQIFTRNYEAKQGYISVDPRPLQKVEDLDTIFNRIKEITKDA